MFAGHIRAIGRWIGVSPASMLASAFMGSRRIVIDVIVVIIIVVKDRRLICFRFGLVLVDFG